MSVLDWSPADRVHVDSLRLRLRSLAARIAGFVGWSLRDGSGTVIRVPPISTDWVRRYESRKRGDP